MSNQLKDLLSKGFKMVNLKFDASKISKNKIENNGLTARFAN